MVEPQSSLLRVPSRKRPILEMEEEVERERAEGSAAPPLGSRERACGGTGSAGRGDEGNMEVEAEPERSEGSAAAPPLGRRQRA